MLDVVTVKIWEKKVDVHRTEQDKDKYQADIYGDGFDYHGVGETPAQALLRVAVFWIGKENDSKR